MPMSTSTAEASADVLLAADALTDSALDVQIQWFRLASENHTKRGDGAAAEMCHSICRLLAAMRDDRQREWKALKRELRIPRGKEPDYPALANL